MTSLHHVLFILHNFESMNAESRFTEITQNTADWCNWSEVMCLWALQMLVAVTTGLQIKQ